MCTEIIKGLKYIKDSYERFDVHLMWQGQRQLFSLLQQTPATQTLSYNTLQIK